MLEDDITDISKDLNAFCYQICAKSEQVNELSLYFSKLSEQERIRQIQALVHCLSKVKEDESKQIGERSGDEIAIPKVNAKYSQRQYQSIQDLN